MEPDFNSISPAQLVAAAIDAHDFIAGIYNGDAS